MDGIVYLKYMQIQYICTFGHKKAIGHSFGPLGLRLGLNKAQRLHFF